MTKGNNYQSNLTPNLLPEDDDSDENEFYFLRDKPGEENLKIEEKYIGFAITWKGTVKDLFLKNKQKKLFKVVMTPENPVELGPFYLN